MLGEEIEVHGSGRTDAGVHAYGQVANFKIKTDMTAEEIMDNINKFLPGDIGIISAWEAEPRFHSRLNEMCIRDRSTTAPSSITTFSISIESLTTAPFLISTSGPSTEE